MLGPIPNGKELHYADNKIGNLKKYPHHSPRNIFFIRRSATMWLRYNPTVATLTNGQISLPRSEEHTSELQSLMRISYAVFCLKKKINRQPRKQTSTHTQSITHRTYRKITSTKKSHID